MDRYRQYSLELIQPALERLRHGDPAAVAYLYRHYSHLHPDAQLMTFRAIAEKLRHTSDLELAARFAKYGPSGFAADHPQLAQAIGEWSNRVWGRAAQELLRPTVGNLYATSPRALVLRNLILRLPLQGIVGAKLRRATNTAMASRLGVLARRRLRSGRQAALELSKVAGARGRKRLAGLLQPIKSRQRPRP